MRVLFITVDVPCDDASGGQIVSYRLVQAYARFARVDVVALTPPRTPVPAALERMVDRIRVVPVPHFYYAHSRFRSVGRFLHAQITGPPFRVAKFSHGEARETVRRWAAERDYDLVHCDHLSTAPYRDLLPRTPAILAEHNIDSELFDGLAAGVGSGLRAALLRREARRIDAFEAECLHGFARVLTLSLRDRDLLAGRAPFLAGRIEHWPVPTTRRRLLPPPDGPLSLVVLGSLRSAGRAAGLRWFLTEVWPVVRGRDPAATLHVVGADPPRDIAARDARDGIRVHGFVGDLEPILGAAHGCAIPLFAGGGIRVKVLELLSRGLPCVGTDVALQGLDGLPGSRVVRALDEWLAALSPEGLAALRGQAAAAAFVLGRERTRDRAAAVLSHAAEAAVAFSTSSPSDA